MSCVNLVEFVTKFLPVPVPDTVRSLPSVLIKTLFVLPPNFILLSEVGNCISPYTVKFLGSVKGDCVPIVTSPSGTSKFLVIFKVPIACVSICVEPVRNVNSVKATCPPVYVCPEPSVTLKHQSVYLLPPTVTYCDELGSGLAFEKSGALNDVIVPECGLPPTVPDHVAELVAKSAKS